MRYVMKFGILLVSAALVGKAQAKPSCDIYQFSNTTIVNGVILDSQGNVYGTAFSGYTNFVFKLTPPVSGSSWTETTLMSFQNVSALTGAISPLVMDSNGNLYGTSGTGGAYNNGYVFELSPPPAGQTQWTEVLLYSFQGGSDGADPQGGLVFDGNRNLYGTTTNGGSANLGTVFQLVPPQSGQSQWTKGLLYSFQGGTDGANPSSAVTLAPDGAIYGSTVSGGEYHGNVKNNGVAYKLTPPQTGQVNWAESIIFTFDDGSGRGIKSQFIMDSQSNLYGTDSSGAEWGIGSVFELSPAMPGQKFWSYTGITEFAYGKYPIGGLAFDQQGNFYGTYSAGSPTRAGILAKFTKIIVAGNYEWEQSTVKYFGGKNGSGPQGTLVLDRSGNIYATLSSGAVCKLPPYNG